MSQGIKPQQGYELMEGRYILGIAGGVNYAAASGVVAAGTTQADAAPLPGNVRLIELDTVASGAGVTLPFAVAGTAISVYNNGGNTVTVYPAVKNNPATGAQDTINTATSVTITNHQHGFFFCAKTGNWAE